MRKIVVAALLIYIGIVFAPWIWLENTFGMHNIPHYDLTMWIFMLLYGILALIGFLGFVAFGVSKDSEQLEETAEESVEEPIEQDLIFDEGTEEEAPAELQVEAPVEETAEETVEEPVEIPEEWAERDFE